MDNETNVPQSHTDGQETVTVEVTPLFYSKQAMSQAALLCGGSKETIAFAWCRIELERGAGAEVKQRITIKQNKVTLEKRFATTAGFTAMEQAGMIRVTADDSAPSVLTDDDFENFWKAYPARDVQGRKVKGVKSNAKRMFHKYIRTREQFLDLLLATMEYATVSNGFPKDAERFLRNNLWRDYMPENGRLCTAPVEQLSTEDKLRIQNERQQQLDTERGAGREVTDRDSDVDAGYNSVSGG